MLLSDGFDVLDVGCGSARWAKGDVNVDFFKRGVNVQIGVQNVGELVDPKGIKNFVVADACHLPFRDDAFASCFSSHVIEHVADPFLMLREMCRVSRGKVVVRFPHRRGSGAKRPFHVNYLDEGWVALAFMRLGLCGDWFVSKCDYPVSERVKPLIPRRFLRFVELYSPYRLLRRFERSLIRRGLVSVPFELEVWAQKNVKCDPVVFVVPINDNKVFDSCFMSSVLPRDSVVVPAFNFDGKSLPDVFGYVVSHWLDADVWLVFCHQDFVLNEDLSVRLSGLSRDCVYGPVGVRDLQNKFYGRFRQTDGSFVGLFLGEPEPVHVLDEMCLIVHSSVFRRGLRFDEGLRFHFFGADLCYSALTLGVGVKVLQLDCQHKSKNLVGDVGSQIFLLDKEFFRLKWKRFLPIKTTVCEVS